jgi:small subunit ribosomal protein S6e
MVKINIAYPPYGSNQLIDVDDERKWRVFLDKRLSEEVPADSLGDEFKGYVFKITGGYDKEGFSMMQGVMLNHRTRLLLDGRTGQYTPKRHGCRKRKSVRGCILGSDMSLINVVIVKRGPTDLPKLTDKASDRPSTKGPKRAGNIRKAWGLTKKDDVRQYVVKKTKAGKDGKKDKIKSPKIQRLITPVVKQRRKRLLKLKRVQAEKSRKDAADYAALLKQIRTQKRVALLSKRREALSSRTATATTTPKATGKKVAPTKATKAVAGKPKVAAKGVAKPKTLTKAKDTGAKKTEQAKTAVKATEKKVATPVLKGTPTPTATPTATKGAKTAKPVVKATTKTTKPAATKTAKPAAKKTETPKK